MMPPKTLDFSSNAAISIALFQPDIPQNVGAMMRVCACFKAHLHIIEPCGFPWKEEKFRRAAMDYRALVELTRHISWSDFSSPILQSTKERLVLMTTKTNIAYTDFSFQKGDILLAGQESKGCPSEVHDLIEHQVTIPMASSARSMNIVNATSMILGEALRQTRE